MPLVDAVPIDCNGEFDKETKSTVDMSSVNNNDEKSNYSQASIKSKTTTDLFQESTNDDKQNKSQSPLTDLKYSERLSPTSSCDSNLIPSITDEDDEELSMNSELDEKLTKEMEMIRLEQQLMWKQEEIDRREEKNKWKEDSIEQWTEELAHREKEIDKREKMLTSREIKVDELEQNLRLIRDELNLGEMDLREYLNKQESIQERREALKSRSDSMKKKNHEAMEKLMKIARTDRSVNNIEDLFRFFDLPVNLNERLSEQVYLNLFRAFFHDLKHSESNNSMISSSSSLDLDSVASSQVNRRTLLSKYKTFEAKMFFLLSERDVVILNLKRKLVEKDQDTLAKEYAIRHKDVTTDDFAACKELIAVAQSRRESDVSRAASLISEASNINECRTSSVVKVNGYIKRKQSLERKRVELLQSMTTVQKKNEEDLVKRVEYLREKETSMLSKDENLLLKEKELKEKEEELKEQRELLASMNMSHQNSMVSLDFKDSDRTKPLQMENLDKSIQISMRKDEEALEALKSEQLATECAAQELRTEAKKKDDEVMQIKLSLMKKKVIGAFLSKEPSTDDSELSAEEKKQKRAHMKALEDESAHMKNIIKGLDVSSRALKLDIKNREDLIRKKKKLGKSWTKMDAKSREAGHNRSGGFTHVDNL